MNLFTVIFILVYTSAIFAQEFNQTVLSGHINAECDAQKGDERGPFGIVYKQNDITHDFLVMTGVYYDTCKELERKINFLKKQNSYLVIKGTGKNLYALNNYVWRWLSVETTDGKQCVSYFVSDCKKNN